MAETTRIKTYIRNRIDSTSNWNEKNPVLLAGEFGIEDDGDVIKIKLGNGSSTWSELPYLTAKNFLGYTSDEINTELEKKVTIATDEEVSGFKTFTSDEGIKVPRGVYSAASNRVFLNETQLEGYRAEPGNGYKYTSQSNSALIVNTDSTSRSVYTDGKIENKKNSSNYVLELPEKNGMFAIDADKANLTGGNDFTGPQTIDSNKVAVETVDSIAAALGLTVTQLNQLIALAKITTVDSNSVTITSNMKTNSYDINS